MSRDGRERRPARRDLLASVSAAAAVGTAGCSLGGSDSSGTVTESDGGGTQFPDTCDTMDGRLDGPLARGLIPIGSDEYSHDTLVFQSFAPPVTHRHHAWYRLVQSFLSRFDSLQELLQFQLGRADRVRTLHPPGAAGFPGYVQHDTQYSRHRLETALAAGSGAAGGGAGPEICSDCIDVTAQPSYRGFAVRSGSRAVLDVLAYDDSRIVVVPEAGGASPNDPEWRVSSQRRFRRLVDRQDDDIVPQYCDDPALRALAAATVEHEFLRVLFRVDDERFAADGPTPAGARAHALGVDFDLVDSTATDADEFPNAPLSTLGVEISLTYRTAFPTADAVDVDAVTGFLERPYPDTGGLQFADPAVEASGRVVSVVERRPLSAVVTS